MEDMLRYIRLHPLPLPTNGNPKDWKRVNDVLYITSLHPLLVDAVQGICGSLDVKLSPVGVKYLFFHPPQAPTRLEGETLPDGLEFGQLASEDLHRVISTSATPRSLEMMALLKHAAILNVSSGKKVPIA